MARTVHIIGAGLAGLAAAVRLSQAGYSVCVHEAAPQAGGRCRSYFDPALGLTIDNGNHVLLSANRDALGFLASIGASDALKGPEEACFPFVDMATNERWNLRPNDGRIPWWIFAPSRRVPRSGALDYRAPLGIILSRADQPIGRVMACSGQLYEKLWHPILLAGLNTPPEEGSTFLAGAMMRESLMAGGEMCRPLIATEGLSAAFVDPALRLLNQAGHSIRFGRRLRALGITQGQVASLAFAEGEEALAAGDQVVLAVPAPVAAELVPGLVVPKRHRAILNAHFRIAPPAGMPAFIGIIGGLSEWVFAFEDRLSVTISAADRLMDEPRESLAIRIWAEVSQVAGLAQAGRDAALPAWQIVKEKRATFAATPEENSLRPSTATSLANLFLAGDWTATGLPATIEGAIRSGHKAASMAASACLAV